VNAGFVDHLEKLNIVPVIDLNTDDHWPGQIESSLQYWGDLIRGADHQTLGAERLGVFDQTDGPR
jgi:hypothetical protein